MSDASVEPSPPCPHCDGSGWAISDDGGAGVASRCRCRPRLDADRRMERAAIPKLYADKALKNFNTNIAGSGDRLIAARRLSEQYVDGFMEAGGRFRSTGLLYSGPPGGGKTHLAVAVLRAVMERYGLAGRFVDFTSLVHQIQATFDPGSEESKRQVLDPVIDADILVLDELGAQRPTPFVNDTLYLVLNARYSRCLPTLFTTNYSLDTAKSGPVALDRPAGPTPAEPLASRIPARLVSRLYEMAQKIELPVGDYRRDFNLARA